jgi:predicted transposase YdaD
VSEDRRQQGVPHAHDGLFRLVFGKPAHAASELRAVLPPELTARLDLERLTPVNGSFVDSALRWRFDPATAAAAAEFLPTFRYLLDDLARIDPAELQARPLTPAVRLTLLVMHAAPRRTDVTEDLESFLGTIQEALHSPDGTEILKAVLTYIQAVTETPADRLQQVMTRLGPEAEEVYMSTADMLRAEGEAKGRTEALAQLLTLKFGTLPDAARTKLRAASAQQLADWTGRVLDATTVDDVFA